MFSLIGLVVVAAVAFLVPVAFGVKTRRLRLTLPVAVVVTVLIAWFGWVALGEATEWDSGTVIDDQVLKINYTGSECEDHHSVSISEDEDSVEVSIKTWSFAMSCSDVGYARQIRVKLDRPLGDRRLIDGACGKNRTSCTRDVAVR